MRYDLFVSFFVHFRIKFALVVAGLDHNVDFIGHCVHGTSSVWHSNARRIDNSAHDFLGGTGTNAVVTRIVDGHFKGHSHGQFDGKSWHTRKTLSQNHHRRAIDLPLWLHALLFGRNTFSSVLLFSAGAYSNFSFGIIIFPVFTFFIIFVQLFDVVYREETLLNVIRSVTRNGRSIIFTAVLALILVYLFSIIGYVFFKDDFLVVVDDELNPSGDSESCTDSNDATLSKRSGSDQSCSANSRNENTESGGERKERSCDSLVMCIITTLNQGLRNGGGIGDILRAPSSNVSISLYTFFVRSLLI